MAANAANPPMEKDMRQTLWKPLVGVILIAAPLLATDIASAASSTRQYGTCSVTGSNDSSAPTFSATTRRNSSYSRCGTIAASFQYADSTGFHITTPAVSTNTETTRARNCNCVFGVSYHEIGYGGTGSNG